MDSYRKMEKANKKAKKQEELARAKEKEKQDSLNQLREIDDSLEYFNNALSDTMVTAAEAKIANDMENYEVAKNSIAIMSQASKVLKTVKTNMQSSMVILEVEGRVSSVVKHLPIGNSFGILRNKEYKKIEQGLRKMLFSHSMQAKRLSSMMSGACANVAAIDMTEQMSKDIDNLIDSKIIEMGGSPNISVTPEHIQEELEKEKVRPIT